MERTEKIGKIFRTAKREKRKLKAESISEFISAGETGIYVLYGIACGAFCVKGYNPVGIACTAAFLGKGIGYYFVLFATLAGYMWTGALTDGYITALVIYALYGIIVEKFAKKQSVASKALSVFMIYSTSGAIQGFVNNDFLNITSKYIIESLLMAALVFVFDKAVSAAKGYNEKRKILSDGMMSLAAVSAFAVAGFSEIYDGTFPLGIIMAVYMVCAFAYVSGAEGGLTAGIFCGITLILGEHSDLKTFAVIAVSSALIGTVADRNRFLMTAVFAVGALVSAYYFSVMNIMPAVLVGSGIFALTAGRLPKPVEIGIKGGGNEKLIAERLNSCCNGIEAVYKSISSMADEDTEAKKETDEMADKVACIICDDCPNSNKCWNNSFYNTYSTLMNLFSACEKRGRAEVGDMSVTFKDCCIRQNEFADAVNTVYSVHREKVIWKMKLGECRQAAKEQLKAVGEAVKIIADDIENRHGFKSNLEGVVLSELRRKDKNIESVEIDEQDTGEYAVCVLRRNCDENEDFEDIKLSVSEILGRKMVRAEKECISDSHGNCKIRFCEKCRYRITSAAAMAIKDGEIMSGDSYSFMELPGGGYMLALSDGMGSGEKAGEESRTVIELLEQLAESGFRRETALKMINSVLVMGAERESFATLDICCIDLYSGEAEIVKTGAAAGFVVRNGIAGAVRSSSLPIGMLKFFDMDSAEIQLERNDIILMLTDGAAEVIDREAMADRLLTEILEGCSLKAPKEIANHVLESIKARADYRINDDMTVVCARMW